MSFAEHRKKAAKRFRIAVLVVSDSRAAAMREGRDEDVTGKIVERRAREAGHETIRLIIPDDAHQIKKEIQRFTADEKIGAVITAGGTGIARRDVTIETVTPLFEKELSGFGEILRHIGFYEKIGGPALLTRATAGLIKRKPVFCLPGAPNAAEVAMDLILPELGHLIKHARE